MRGWRSCAPFFAMTLAALASASPSHRPASVPSTLESQADEFVNLALALGRLRSAEVDAYFGPAELQAGTKSTALSLESLSHRVRALRVEVDAYDNTTASERRARLRQQIRALEGLIAVINSPAGRKFDDEAQAVYGMAPVVIETDDSKATLRALGELLPGKGSLVSRITAFRNQFIVPAGKRRAVFERALTECRARTLAKWKLPAGEQLKVVWTSEVPAAWHRYEGHGRSTLQLNPAAVGFLGSAIDVACHEGYPGHHAQFVVMEAGAGASGLAVEDTVVLLRSPISMLREGAANYGVDLAFPPLERLAFERDVLFPLAGFDPARAARYVEVHRLIGELGRGVVPILRDYRDKRVSATLASRALESSALVSSPDALLHFVDELGPYVLGYTAARDNVRDYIEARHERTGADQWALLRTMLARADVTPLGPILMTAIEAEAR